jgi:glycosyltransferase involved in cell wall biosynthesis
MQNSKRLLIVITQAELGGAQSYVFRCAKEAIRRGFEVLVAAGGEGALETRCKNASVPYRRLLKLKRELSPVHDIQAIRELASLMKEWRPDAVFLHSSKTGVVGSIAARMARVPRTVYRIAGWSFLDPVSNAQKTIRRWSERLTAPMKDVIITLHPNDEKLAHASRIKPREAIVTIPNGLDLAGFDANLKSHEEAQHILNDLWQKGTKPEAPSADALRASRGTNDPDSAVLRASGFVPSPVILTIANFYPTKNLLGYLDAISIVHAQKQDATSGRDRRGSARFLIIGDGEQREALLEKRRSLNLDSVVAFAGQRDDAATLLRGTDLFVLPSVKEGMPWTVLEAMAAALPCVVTDVGANKWMLGDAGTVVPAGDAQKLADAIEQRLDDVQGSADMGLRARKTLESRFTEREMWDKTFQILDRSVTK